MRSVLARADLPSASQALANVFAAVEEFSHEQTDDRTAVVLRRKHEPI
jgi:hypothetical protein